MNKYRKGKCGIICIGTKMNDEELPIGFSMELAKHLDVLNHFSNLSDSEKKNVIENARQIKSRDKMRSYVESLFHDSFY